jgi:hypothetical protein
MVPYQSGHGRGHCGLVRFAGRYSREIIDKWTP